MSNDADITELVEEIQDLPISTPAPTPISAHRRKKSASTTKEDPRQRSILGRLQRYVKPDRDVLIYKRRTQGGDRAFVNTVRASEIITTGAPVSVFLHRHYEPHWGAGIYELYVVDDKMNEMLIGRVSMAHRKDEGGTEQPLLRSVPNDESSGAGEKLSFVREALALASQLGGGNGEDAMNQMASFMLMRDLLRPSERGAAQASSPDLVALRHEVSELRATVRELAQRDSGGLKGELAELRASIRELAHRDPVPALPPLPPPMPIQSESALGNPEIFIRLLDFMQSSQDRRVDMALQLANKGESKESILAEVRRSQPGVQELLRIVETLRGVVEPQKSDPLGDAMKTLQLMRELREFEPRAEPQPMGGGFADFAAKLLDSEVGYAIAERIRTRRIKKKRKKAAAQKEEEPAEERQHQARVPPSFLEAVPALTKAAEAYEEEPELFVQELVTSLLQLNGDPSFRQLLQHLLQLMADDRREECVEMCMKTLGALRRAGILNELVIETTQRALEDYWDDIRAGLGLAEEAPEEETEELLEDDGAEN